jgi:hypothetical protein
MSSISQEALYLHIRILWLLLERSAVPALPAQAALAAFNSRFTSEDDIFASRQGSPIIEPASVHVARASLVQAPSKHAKDAARVEEFMLEYLRSFCAKYGLDRWCPDLRDTPYSLYNSAHRLVALDTFRQFMTIHAYAFLGPNPQYLQDLPNLTRVYDHFVFHVQLKLFKKDQKNPGSVLSADAKKSLYEPRSRASVIFLVYVSTNKVIQLSKARGKAATEIGLSRTIINAVKQPDATSDDEYDPGLNAYHIKSKNGRSSVWTQFVRRLDEHRTELRRLTTNRKTGERTRVVPEYQRTSPFTALPTDMPLDYFDPGFYNSLPVKLRRRITGPRPRIALPPPTIHIFDPHDPWRKMSYREHMDTYGNSILALYHVPGPDEDDGRDNSTDDDNKEDEYSSEETQDMEFSDDEEEVVNARGQFTQRMMDEQDTV